MRSILRGAVVVAVLAGSVAGCSKGNTSSPVSPSSPTAPSPGTPSPGSAAGASISGMVVTGSTPTLASVAGLNALTSAGRVTVSITGTSITAISDAGGNFTLQNVPPGNLSLTISGNGFTVQVAMPTISTDDQVRVTIRVNGGAASIDDDEIESADHHVEVEGQITSASNGTIVLGRLNTQVFVPPTASITKGSTTLAVSDLVVGLRVHVRAVKTGSTLTATTVIVQTDNPGGNGNDNKPGNGSSADNGNGNGNGNGGNNGRGNGK